MSKVKNIAIVGAGLVGSLLAIYLRNRGYYVTVFERRRDMRKEGLEEGRSINLALSNRGLRALDEISLTDEIRRLAIPMHGRIMHAFNGALTFQPYGKAGQFINSISRRELNVLLMNVAEEKGVRFNFNHRITNVDFVKTSITFTSRDISSSETFDAIVGADGAFSAVRHSMQFTARYNFSQHYIEHGYKELEIPATSTGDFALDQNALHIWPRERFMLIALPNPNATFTCTLFLPFDGESSFNMLTADEKIIQFFQRNFPDASSLIPNLLDNFKQNPTASLVTMKCFPWAVNKTLLIGDSAHAIVPFYGQGMNAGFEDCRVLNALLDDYKDDWITTLQAFQQNRKPDTDAIAKLALDNFIEMRDLVADPEFLLRKKIEAKLHSLFPDQWIPLYSMVTFNENIRYSEALRIGKKQKEIMDKVMSDPSIKTTWEHLDFERLVRQLQAI